MKRLKYIVAATATALAVLASVALPKLAGAIPVDNEDNVTICHRTNSVKNPYVRITVDQSAVDGEGNNDHSNHTGPVATSEAVAQALKDAHVKWGDIIPPFDENPGLNWDAVGMAVFENGCLGGEEIEEVVPAAVTFVAPTCDKQGSYTIPTTENVVYKVDDSVVAAGTYTAANGSTVTVTAEATEGHFIPDEATDTWTNTFTAPANCGQVLSQVTTKPKGSVGAGAGGGSASSVATIVGLAGSASTLGLGLLVRKWTN